MNVRHPELESASLYGILDTGYLPLDQFAAMAEKLMRGRVGILQIRAKKESATVRSSLVEAVLPLCLDRGVPLIVNDDLSVALRYPEVGLHIGQDDLPPEQVRRELGSGRIVGLSTHSETQAADAYKKYRSGLIDYFAVGPVFPTQTKPDYTPVTTNLVKWVIEQRYEAPHFFIGGINKGTLGQLVNLGARRVVVVSDLLTAADPAQAAGEMVARLRTAS